MAKQVKRSACIIESAGVSPLLDSSFRPLYVTVLVGAEMDSSITTGLPRFIDVPLGSGPTSSEHETKRNWVIGQMCRAGYDPIGTPGPNDLRFKYSN